MIYTGSCHCGGVVAEYHTEVPVQLRRDGCSFCSTRGVKSASDPNGKLKLRSRQALIRYRFGHRTADFLLCPTCGTYVATIIDAEGWQLGVLNVVGMNILELRDLPAQLASLEGETVEERMARRLARWTPLTLEEPGSDASLRMMPSTLQGRSRNS
jgi:hypothetical protein